MSDAKSVRTALTIAGSDPSGGAGLQADLKTFHQHGVYGMAVVTLLTVQNTVDVKAVEVCNPDIVVSQLVGVLEDIPPNAAKTGALGNASVIRAVAAELQRIKFPLVVDPVMISKHGAQLLDEAGEGALKERLLPIAFLVTPNIMEAEVLSGLRIKDSDDMCKAAERILQLGVKHVLIKGGHLEGAAVDVLYSDGEFTLLETKRIATQNTHGTGCVFSAALTARLARGESLQNAAKGAKRFITTALQSATKIGSGIGPTNMHASPDEREGS